MFIPFLISFREAFEASLIIGVLLGILEKFGLTNYGKIVAKATFLASSITVLSIFTISILGQKLLNLITTQARESFEGIMLIISTIFITWAIFWLHTHLQFRRGKHVLIVHEKVKQGDFNGFFMMVFTLIIREGIEIVLFLSTLIFSTPTKIIVSESIIGILAAVIFGYLIYTATIKINLKIIFQTTTFLLVFFSAGLLIRGIDSLTQAHLLPQFHLFVLNLPFIPRGENLLSEVLKTFLGLEPVLTFPQYTSYLIYLTLIAFLLNKIQTRRHPYVTKD